MAKKRSAIQNELLELGKTTHVNPKATLPLTFALPIWNTVMGPNGWYHRPWTKEELAEARRNHFKIDRNA